MILLSSQIKRMYCLKEIKVLLIRRGVDRKGVKSQRIKVSILEKNSKRNGGYISWVWNALRLGATGRQKGYRLH